ncbi:hypothetical protein J8J40_34255, partial [Mycobacterium tuberculosis]|nr:hypothetical protein [Mycobacterium tuberculosis]
AWDVRDDWAYEGGAFRTALNVGWGLQMAVPAARRAADAAAVAALTAPGAGRSALLAHAEHSPYADWAGDAAAHWARISP